MPFTASPLPNGKKQFCDNNGIPLAGGSVSYYVIATTNPKTTWVDEGQVVANPTTITLDAGGRAVVFGSGDYREVVKDNLGNTIWDQVTNVPPVNSGQLSGSQLLLSGNVSAPAWLTAGERLVLASATFTDTTSAGASGTVYIDAHKSVAIAASNVCTFSAAYGAYFESPTAGANVTLTTIWALGADSLKVAGPVSLAGITNLGIRDTSAAFDVTLGMTSSTNLTAGRALTVDVGNASRTLKLTGNPTIADWFDQAVKTTSTPTFAGVLSSLSASGAVTNTFINVLTIGLGAAANNQTYDLVAFVQGTSVTASTKIVLSANVANLSNNVNSGGGLTINNNGGSGSVLVNYTGSGTIQYTLTRTG